MCAAVPLTANTESTNYFILKVACVLKVWFSASVSSSTGSPGEVPLLGPGRGGLLFERQVVIRRRAHEAFQNSDADTCRQNARHHGQAERIPDCVTQLTSPDHCRLMKTWFHFYVQNGFDHICCKCFTKAELFMLLL